MREQILAMIAAVGEAALELQDRRRSRLEARGWFRREDTGWVAITGEIPAVPPST